MVFREYDIRGIVGTELHIEQVYDVVCAIAYYCAQLNPAVKKVAIGMDGRTHSPAIKEQACRALIDSGLEVIFVGVCPSPVVYFAIDQLPVDMGIMITASHNPQEYNGIKIDLGHRSLWGNDIRMIRDCYKQGLRLVPQEQGSYLDQPLIPRYIAWLREHFAHLVGMHMPVVIDCGNGAGGAVVPDLVQAMEWPDVTLLYAEVDGTYPNHEADPSHEKNMLDLRVALKEHKARVGIGLDGDADRMGVMSADGWLVPADRVLALFARTLIDQHPEMAVVIDINASDGLVESLQTCGARPYFSPCGHAIVKTTMEQHGALLGGELSCHFFFADRHPGYDDGIYAMMRFFEIMVTSTTSLESMLDFFPKKYSSPIVRVACPEEKKFWIVDQVKHFLSMQPNVTLITVDGVRVCTAYGWGLVRASNTQAMLSMRFESDSQEGLHTIQTMIVSVLQQYMDTTALCVQLGLKELHEKSRNSRSLEQLA